MGEEQALIVDAQRRIPIGGEDEDIQAAIQDEMSAMFNEARRHWFLPGINPCFWMAFFAGYMVLIGYLSHWAMHTDHSSEVLVAGLVLVFIRILLNVINGSAAQEYFLPAFLEFSPADKWLFFSMIPVPLSSWTTRYGEDQIRCRDSLQVCVPHVIMCAVEMGVFSIGLSSARMTKMDVLAAAILAALALSTAQMLGFYFQMNNLLSYTQWMSWSMFWNPSERIMSCGKFRHMHCPYQFCQACLSIGVLMCWCLLLTPLFPPSEYALVMQILIVSAALGSVEEVVTCFYGQHLFEWPSMGEVHIRCVEGTVAMFMACFILTEMAIIWAWSWGYLVSGGIGGWSLLNLVIAGVTTGAGIIGIESIRFCTLPMAASTILYLFGLWHLWVKFNSSSKFNSQDGGEHIEMVPDHLAPGKF